MPRQAALPAWLSLHILRHAGKATCRVPPVTSTLGLAGGTVQVQRAVSALRSRSQTPNACERNCCLSSGRRASYPAQALRAGESPRSPSLRPWSVVVGASRRRAAPRSQFVGAPRADGLACFAVTVHATLERAAASRLPTSVRAQVRARPNRAFNRRRHGRPPCPRGAVCLSCTARARRPAASPGYLYVRQRVA